MATFSHGLPGSSTGRRGCSLCVGRLRRQVSQRSINLVMSRLIPSHQMALASRSRHFEMPWCDSWSRRKASSRIFGDQNTSVRFFWRRISLGWVSGPSRWLSLGQHWDGRRVLPCYDHEPVCRPWSLLPRPVLRVVSTSCVGISRGAEEISNGSLQMP